MKKPLGLRDDVTVHSIAARGRAYFIMIILVAILPAFIEGFDLVMFSFAAPVIVENIQVPIAALGILVTGNAIGMAVFSIAGGFLFDKYSVKNIILASVAVFSVFTVA